MSEIYQTVAETAKLLSAALGEAVFTLHPASQPADLIVALSLVKTRDDFWDHNSIIKSPEECPFDSAKVILAHVIGFEILSKSTKYQRSLHRGVPCRIHLILLSISIHVLLSVPRHLHIIIVGVLEACQFCSPQPLRQPLNL